jgi:uncharacterized protein (DUF2141 family)
MKGRGNKIVSTNCEAQKFAPSFPMKQILWSFLLLIVGNEIMAQGSIAVTITNIENNKGVCKTCLFNNATAFGGNGEAFRCADVSILNKKASVVFEAVPAGRYAIAVFHDANRNNKIDKNFLGIPSEGYGASKNKLPFASAPTFKDNQFAVVDKGTVNVGIKLRNL